MMTFKEAIEYIVSCRDTHTDVVDYFDQGSTLEDWIEDYGLEESLGDREFHQKCVDDYNEVIRVLESYDGK